MTAKPVLYTIRELDEPLCVPYDEALTALEKGTFTDEHGLMRWGSNYTFLITTHYEDLEFMAIYKPRRGERPLWDFPDGTLCQRETASYLLSEMLGWYLVPPTVLRDGSHGIGSIQLFINHDPNRHYFTFDSSHIPQLQRMAAFDAVVNNADRKGGHCLLDDDERLWGIDHGLTFHPSHKLRTVIWDFAGHPIPDELVVDLETLCTRLRDKNDTYTNHLIEMLSQREMRALQERVDRLVQTRIYPLPGAGPNRPWPAV